MKTLPLCGLLVVLSLAAGCVSRYDVTLTNQRVITTQHKPKFNKENNTFRFTDIQGKEHIIPSFNVREITAR
jgi:hypothetical protein